MPWPKGKPKPPEMIAKLRASLQLPETKQKMRAAASGRVLSASHKQKIGESLMGHSVTAETRAKLSEAHTGKKLSESHRENMRQAILRLWDDPDYRARQSRSHKGKPGNRAYRASPETIEKLRASHTGKKRTLASRLSQSKSMSGSNHFRWVGRPAPKSYRGAAWGAVKRAVRERANHKCEFCGSRNVLNWKLDVHHVVPYRLVPVSVEWACLGLCRKCHIHAEIGRISTASLQSKLRPRLERFIEDAA